MDITDGQALRARFAETYSHHDDPHLLRKFERYEIVQSCRDATGAGAQKLSNWTGVLQGLINGWIYQDSSPRGYESVQRAESLGLFDLSWDGKQFRGINELVAWIMSGGIISEDGWVPTFSVELENLDVCTAAVERAGAPAYTTTATPGDGNTKSVRITEAGSIFSRLFVALGAPQGNKHKTAQQFGLPCYLGVAPEPVRRRFADIYLLNRGVRPHDRNALVISEERPDAYLEALAGLFRSLTAADVSRDADGRLYIGESVLSEFDVPKKWESE